MKIKRERQVRLDELMKYVWDKNITRTRFEGKDCSIYVDDNGNFKVVDEHTLWKSDLYTITEEVEITEDAPINLVYRIKTEKGWQTFDKNETPINRIINTYKRHPHAYLGFIYLQNPNGSIGELIWTKERGLID